MKASAWRFFWLIVATVWLVIGAVLDAHYATTNALVCVVVAWVGPGASA